MRFEFTTSGKFNDTLKWLDDVKDKVPTKTMQAIGKDFFFYSSVTTAVYTIVYTLSDRYTNSYSFLTKSAKLKP